MGETLRPYLSIQPVDLLKLWKAKDGAEVRVTIRKRLVFLRKGTPDLKVALSCLKLGEFDRLGDLLPRSFPGVIVDAGGYIGTAAIQFSRMFPLATVVTLEPESDNLRVLTKNVEGISNIRVFGGALVSRKRSGTVVLLDPGLGEWGYSVATREGSQPLIRLGDVRAVSLDWIQREYGEVGVLKLDIEGGELDLFLNDGELVAAIPILVAELHDHLVPGCSEAMAALGTNRQSFRGRDEKVWSIAAQNQ